MYFSDRDCESDYRREQPRTRHDRYMEYIDKIEPSFAEFGDGWGGGTIARDIAMRAFPYDEWDG